MNENILYIDSIKKGFAKDISKIRKNGESNRLYIIDDFDLMVPREKITALIGGNGAGKTTLFNIISRFVEPESGNIIYYNNKEVEILKTQPYLVSRLGIGRMFQNTRTFSNMTVLENMLIADSNDFGEIPFISFFLPKKNNIYENERIEKAKQIFVKLFGENNKFWEIRNNRAGSLSYGEQRLLSLARLFMNNYKLVLLDEPTSGVNPNLISKIIEIIKKMVFENGMSVFLIEHNMKVVLDLADFCCFMSHGKVAAFGTSDDVISNDEVRRSYLGI